MENSKTDYQIYNIGTGTAVPILEVTKKLKELINYKCDIKITDYHRPGDIMHAYGNIDKFRKDMNWKPKFTLEQGLSNFTKWFKEQTI
jgi:nucleoside-diphosphate-sugar epimerase